LELEFHENKQDKEKFANLNLKNERQVENEDFGGPGEEKVGKTNVEDGNDLDTHLIGLSRVWDHIEDDSLF